MAGLEGLTSIIYHEKQQSGSMLCAQHALNSLLQGPFFTAPDLSEIAHNLDVLEDSYDTEGTRDSSRNMDDTGFFSIQVLDEALKVWGLNLVRWRSADMRPYQNHPHTQLAFILNLEQHWFTLRRFGPASAKVDEDPGEGHWFNLNSFLSTPEWVSKTYLGMVLQQAETEGYSVFAVTQADQSAPLALSRTEADDIAMTLPEPTSAGYSSVYNATKRNTDRPGSSSNHTSSKRPSHGMEHIEGLDDEDYELQAVLQASLASQGGYISESYETEPPLPPILPPQLVRASTSQTYSSVASRASTHSEVSSADELTPPEASELDPVAASMERNRVLLQRLQQEQEMAQRELMMSNDVSPQEQAAQEARREQRRRQEEQEEEELKRAIAESEAMALEQGQQGSIKGTDENQSDSDYLGQPSSSYGGSGQTNRIYDDEDAELQAALKASLEHVPPGWQHSELAPAPVHRHQPPSTSTVDNTSASKDGSGAAMDVDEYSDSESVSPDVSGETENTSVPVEEPSTALSIDEIRKARLARFGL